MFIKINYEITRDYTGYHTEGEKLYKEMGESIQKELGSYIGVNGSINGTDLQDNWFPEINCDIFLSHSHNDKERAISFAGFLKREFGLTTFIDSCLWGYCDKLLKQIDDKYCMNDNYTYDYSKRNISTSHVHMMLSSAITKMIDKTECVIFLNTNNSIVKIKDIVEENTTRKTSSAWIYSELVTTQVMRRSPLYPEDRNNKFFYKKKEKKTYEYVQENMQILYNVEKSLENFYRINDSEISNWKQRVCTKNLSKIDALDNLYLSLIGGKNGL